MLTDAGDSRTSSLLDCFYIHPEGERGSLQAVEGRRSRCKSHNDWQGWKGLTPPLKQWFSSKSEHIGGEKQL